MYEAARPESQQIFRRLVDYYRCPERYALFAPHGPFTGSNGYFRFGKSAICYGKCGGNPFAESPDGALPDARAETAADNGVIRLPFDPSEVAENLLLELYVKDWREDRRLSPLAGAYYLVRPFLSVGFRRHLQRVHLAGWETIPFPSWPVDFSIDDMYIELLATSLRFSSVRKIPFIWPWPDGASSCSLMTHDVEAQAGREFCSTLMDLDDSFRIKSSFQIIPEKRYSAKSDFLALIHDRGFEVAVHDLNHDGRLFRNREEFLDRAARINAYGKKSAPEVFAREFSIVSKYGSTRWTSRMTCPSPTSLIWTLSGGGAAQSCPISSGTSSSCLSRRRRTTRCSISCTTTPARSGSGKSISSWRNMG